MKTKLRKLCAAGLAVCMANIAGAASYLWTGAADNDWNNTANWAGGTVPILATGDLLGNNDTITIQNGFGPSVNVPAFAANSGDRISPNFILESGVTFSIARGASQLTGITGIDTKAVVGDGASLTYVLTNGFTALGRNSAGIQSYEVNGGTLTFNATGQIFSLGDRVDRLSSIIIDGGVVNVLTGTAYMLGSSDATSLVSAVGTENTIILKNGGSFTLETTMQNMTVRGTDNDGSAVAYFDLQSVGSTVTFSRGRDFNSEGDVIAQFGNVFRSSTFGIENLVFTNLGSNRYEVSVVPEPTNYALLAGLLGLSWVMIRRRVLAKNHSQ
jgi:hypothetical protein